MEDSAFIHFAPWLEAAASQFPDQVKRFVYQGREEASVAALPHVLKPLPLRPTVMGTDSAHQTGGLICYDILTRGPLHDLTCHFSDIRPQAAVRGAHRHISAPTLFCTSGKGWEWNDGKTYDFEVYDLLVVPPYTTHQHGGDREIGCKIYVPQTRMIDVLGLLHREQIKFSERPSFPEGTEPLRDGDGQIVGYRIKKGVLGITEDLDVYLGPSPDVEGVFRSRIEARAWTGGAANTYDRYLQLLQEEVDFCKKITHVIRYEEQPWEWTRHGRLKWYVHPDVECSARRVWLYMHEIPPGSRSGRHRHIHEEQVFVLSGKGYDIHDGQRWNWEQGDLINIPAMTEHQHFNLDAADPALLYSSMPSMGTDLGLGGIEHFEDAPEWSQRS